MTTRDELLAGLPGPLPLTHRDVLAARGASAQKIVVIDDHPAGSQAMADVPLLTAWSADQVDWALGVDAPVVYVVVNSRGLAASAAEDRYLEVVSAFLDAAAARRVDVRFVLRADGALRGHFPLDVDVVVNAIESTTAARIDGVVLVPAFPDAGRITVHGVHYVAGHGGTQTPIGESEFARDQRFGFTSSDLRSWVAEKTRGRVDPSSVLLVDLATVRTSPDAVAARLALARRGQCVVVDAASEEDLRSIAIGLVRAQAAGRRFLCRVGSPFVRALIGQPEHAPLTGDQVEALRVAAGTSGPETGIVVVGTPVPFTRRQVRVLEQRHPVRDVPLSVPALLDGRREGHIEEVVTRALAALEVGNVVVRLAEMHVEADSGDFTVDPRVGRAVNEVVYRIAKARRLKFVVARGASIASHVAQGLGVRRAWVRGPMLPGKVSLWEPLAGPIAGVPFVVYAGAIGDDDGLADVVDELSGVEPPTLDRYAAASDAGTAPASGETVAVIGLGSRGLPIACRLSGRFRTPAFDIDPRRREAAAREGVSVATSAAEAVGDASFVLVAVRGADGLEEVLFGERGIAGALRPGAVVGLLMAVGVREAQRVAAGLAERGVHTLDLPVSGGGDRARRGELVVLVGGPDAVADAVSPVLEHLAATVVRVGPTVGDGQAMKAVNQLLVAVNLTGLAEALSLGAALGLDPALTLRALGAGAASSFMVMDRGPRMVEAIDGAEPHPVNRLDVTAGDLSIALETARDGGVPTPVAAAAGQVFLAAGRRLPPDADDSALVRVGDPG